jgi:hypothetical protein
VVGLGTGVFIASKTGAESRAENVMKALKEKKLTLQM